MDFLRWGINQSHRERLDRGVDDPRLPTHIIPAISRKVNRMRAGIITHNAWASLQQSRSLFLNFWAQFLLDKFLEIIIGGSLVDWHSITYSSYPCGHARSSLSLLTFECLCCNFLGHLQNGPRKKTWSTAIIGLSTFIIWISLVWNCKNAMQVQMQDLGSGSRSNFMKLEQCTLDSGCDKVKYFTPL